MTFELLQGSRNTHSPFTPTPTLYQPLLSLPISPSLTHRHIPSPTVSSVAHTWTHPSPSPYSISLAIIHTPSHVHANTLCIFVSSNDVIWLLGNTAISELMTKTATLPYGGRDNWRHCDAVRRVRWRYRQWINHVSSAQHTAYSCLPPSVSRSSINMPCHCHRHVLIMMPQTSAANLSQTGVAWQSSILTVTLAAVGSGRAVAVK